MTSTPDEATTTPEDRRDREAMRDLARERVEAMPAESALGHADPAGGSDADPQTYDGDENG